MDDVLCILSCGNSIPFKDLKCKEDGIECWICHSHNINIQECLKIPFNRLNLSQKELELEKLNFERLNVMYNACRADSDYFIEESLKNVKNELDLRREKLKKQIDDYYFELYEKIEKDFESKKTKFNQNVKIIEDFASREEMNSVESNVKILKEKNDLIKNSIDELKRENFVLSPSVDIKNLFGELEILDDPNQSKATFQFVVENFSKFKLNLETRTSPVPCLFRNMHWKLQAESRMKKDVLGLDVFLVNNNKTKSTKSYCLKATVELKLIHPNDSSKVFVKKFGHLFTHKEDEWGYAPFITMKELTEKGYHDIINDSIKLEATLSVVTLNVNDKI